MPNNPAPLLTLNEVASILRAAPRTVRGWASEGRLSSVRTPGGHHRFRREDVEAFLAKQEPAA